MVPLSPATREMHLQCSLGGGLALTTSTLTSLTRNLCGTCVLNPVLEPNLGLSLIRLRVVGMAGSGSQWRLVTVAVAAVATAAVAAAAAAGVVTAVPVAVARA